MNDALGVRSSYTRIGSVRLLGGFLVASLGACVGGTSSAEDGGAGSGSTCLPCGGSCFDCGAGCFCSDTDASTDNGPWLSPIDNLGEPGTWRGTGGSTFCPEVDTLDSVDLWSDSRGVYVMLAGATAVNIAAAGQDNGGMDVPAGAGGAGGVGGVGGGTAGVGGGGISGGTGCFGSSCAGESVWFNNGESGWQRIHQRREANSFGMRRLSGLNGGPQVLYGAEDNGIRTCSLGRLDEQRSWTCDRTSGPAANGTTVRAASAFFGVSETLAYAAVANQLLRFDGTAWGAYGPSAPVEIQTLWADNSSVIALSDQGPPMLLRDGAWTTPFGELQASSVWGQAADHVWFTDFQGGLWHFDGTDTTLTTKVGENSCFGDVPLQLWGAGDTLYLYGERSLFRWNGTQLDELANWTCNTSGSVSLSRVWGNGPNEVFVLLRDFNRFAFDSCGDGAVMYFDGTTFHAL